MQHTQMNSKVATCDSLDFQNFREGNRLERAAFCKSFVDSLQRTGFVKLRNHSVAEKDIRDGFNWISKFFLLPDETKSLIKHPKEPNPHRGWSEIGRERTSAVTDYEKGVLSGQTLLFDIKEAYDMGSPVDDLYDNTWLSESVLPGFRVFMEHFYGELQNLHLQLLSALEEGLEDRVGGNIKFRSRCQKNVSELRLNYYPAVDVSQLRDEKINRISSHTDFGTLTLLFQDSVGGLEIEDQKNFGTFIPIECESETELLVNVGDSMQHWTNDDLVSVNHKVTLPVSMKDKERGQVASRASIAYFAKPDRDASLAPFSQFVRDTKPARYANITAYEHNQTKLKRIYG